jgi:Lon protease-like protein
MGGMNEFCAEEPRLITAPLFPLGHPALFPSMAQPFQIFEPRYRVMTADALAGEGLIAMATLKPGWEPDYNTKTVAIEPIVCVGRIAAHEKLEDGRYLLMLRGVCRAEILEEVQTDEPYRVGQLKELKKVIPNVSKFCRDKRRKDLMEALSQLCPQTEHRPALAPLLASDICLGELCDVLAFALKMPAHESYRVLAEIDIDRRSEFVLDVIRRRLQQAKSIPSSSNGKCYPPGFSCN